MVNRLLQFVVPWPPASTAGSTGLLILFSLTMLLMNDFACYLIHYLQHRVPIHGNCIKRITRPKRWRSLPHTGRIRLSFLLPVAWKVCSVASSMGFGCSMPITRSKSRFLASLFIDFGTSLRWISSATPLIKSRMGQYLARLFCRRIIIIFTTASAGALEQEFRLRTVVLGLAVRYVDGAKTK